MAKAPVRHYPDEATRRAAEELTERRREACREAAPMLARNMVEMDLEAEGLIDTTKGEHVVDVSTQNGETVITIQKDREIN